MVVAAGVLWLLVALAWKEAGLHGADEVLRHNLVEYGGLLLFLLAAMTFVNTLEERHVFVALRSALVARRFSLPRDVLADRSNHVCSLAHPRQSHYRTRHGCRGSRGCPGMPRFITPACINIVVAANAGGAFSPFGDITTLMVWQKGLVGFSEFFALLIPSLVNWLIPAIFMSFTIPAGQPPPDEQRAKNQVRRSRGDRVVRAHDRGHRGVSSIRPPPAFPRDDDRPRGAADPWLLHPPARAARIRQPSSRMAPPGFKPATKPFDIFISVKRVEWDTLLFFYGVVLCVGALGAFGFLALLSQASYASLGDTWSNIAVGVASALIDNIPIMFAVLTMNPDMSQGQWLLVTLTAGVGGSLLSIGSAAGVALMGQARGIYTFFAHLKWTWAIALGYAASIYVHFLVNAKQF